MSFIEKYIPLDGVNINVSPALLPKNMATFIKNLVYSIDDVSGGNGGSGVFKTYQSNRKYIDSLILPEGENHCIGALSSKETNQVFVWIYNSLGNHLNYVINGSDQTFSIISKGNHLNYKLNPEHFIHKGAATITVIWITNPDTGEKEKRTYLHYTDNFNPQRFVCVEDAIKTNGFDGSASTYFQQPHDPNIFINAGVAPPKECIEINELPNTKEDETKIKKLLFNGWQFRARYVDVWGRPSECGIISRLYIPGNDDCISSSDNIPRCVQLLLEVPPINIDRIEVMYSKNNSRQWYISDTLKLYEGDVTGDWWNRHRNENIRIDPDTGKIEYIFCNDKECKPVSTDATSRLENPLPKTSLSISSIGDVLGYSNNKYGFYPLSDNVLNKINVSVSKPNVNISQSQSRNITIYIAIYNMYYDRFTGVFKDGNNGYGWGDHNDPYGRARSYKQYFKNENQSGFYGYLVGGGSAISTQMYISNNEPMEDANIAGVDISELKYNGYGFVLQKFTFSNVSPGKYIFALASHLSDPNEDGDIRNTSTLVYGVFPLKSKFIPDTKIQSGRSRHELMIDVCDGDYDTLIKGEMMVVADIVFREKSGGVETLAVCACGYVKESSNPDRDIPMDMMGIETYGENIFTSTINEQNTSIVADRNGFYWACVIKRDLDFSTNYILVYFRFVNKCINVFRGLKLMTNNITYVNLNIENIEGNKYFDYSTTLCNRALIKGRIVLSGTNIGIPNTGVSLTNGRYVTTDSSGNFTIIAHDKIDGDRNETILILNGKCRFRDANGDCLTGINVRITRCVSCDGDRIFDVGNINVTIDSVYRGLLSGGVYPVGVAGKDWLDRSQFVQDLGYITVPSFQEVKSFMPSIVNVNIDQQIQLPENIERLVFYIGEETTIQSYITWIVDRFEFIDNTGEVNNTAPTQIKIYYSSLIEYNKQNNYNTTANFGFINNEVGGDTYTNDNVLFLINGDGQPFDKTIIARVKYDKSGNYFFINYTEDLKNIKNNAFIRLYRNKECVNEAPMYEICNSIKVTDGVPEVLSFQLDAFDTYYVNREIPVPTPIGDDNETTNELRFFGYPFEHDSPSDFWGKGIKNIGRANIKNPYETVIYRQDEIALSGSFADTGYVNYLNYFDEKLKTEFGKSNLNGIVSVVAKTGIAMFIGQNNVMTVGYDDNIVRVNKDGTLRIPSASELFGRSNVSPLFNYGCLIKDKNTISEKDGIVWWLDANEGAVIRHDFSQAKNVSSAFCDWYIRTKIKFVHNEKEGIRYFHGGVNPINSDYILSDKIIGEVFTNHLREYDYPSQESSVYSLQRFKGWVTFIGEMYSELDGERNEKQFFSFKNGVPYMHYQSGSKNGHGIFFGEKAERIIEVVINTDNLKKKKPLAIGVYSKGLFWVDKILSESGQESWIPKGYWRQGNMFWSAPILCDINSVNDTNGKINQNALTDGDPLYGGWIKVRFVGDGNDDDKYNELAGITGDVFPEEKSSATS